MALEACDHARRIATRHEESWSQPRVGDLRQELCALDIRSLHCYLCLACGVSVASVKECHTMDLCTLGTRMCCRLEHHVRVLQTRIFTDGECHRLAHRAAEEWCRGLRTSWINLFCELLKAPWTWSATDSLNNRYQAWMKSWTRRGKLGVTQTLQTWRALDSRWCGLGHADS